MVLMLLMLLLLVVMVLADVVVLILVLILVLVLTLVLVLVLMLVLCRFLQITLNRTFLLQQNTGMTSWDSTVLMIDTKKRDMLPIIHLTPYDVGESKEFKVEIGHVCFA